MNLTKKQINEIIENEIIVDCYDDEEITTGWATYLDDNLSYPFTAEYQVKKKGSRKEWMPVKVINNDSSGVNYESRHYYVEIEVSGLIWSVKLSDLRNVKADKETKVAVQVNQHRGRY